MEVEWEPGGHSPFPRVEGSAPGLCGLLAPAGSGGSPGVEMLEPAAGPCPNAARGAEGRPVPERGGCEAGGVGQGKETRVGPGGSSRPCEDLTHIRPVPAPHMGGVSGPQCPVLRSGVLPSR